MLYEAYFIASLVLNIDWQGAPLNPGNPYIGSKTQNGFATMGGPDIAGDLAAVAAEAIKAVWYQNGGSICATVRNPAAQSCI